MNKVGGHGGGDDTLDRFVANGKAIDDRKRGFESFVLFGDGATELGCDGESGVFDVVNEDGRKEVTIIGGTSSSVDTLQKTFRTKGLEVRNAELPESARGRSRAMKTESTAQRDGDDLVETMII